MTATDVLCPEIGPAGLQCQRWPQPNAHTDGWHDSGAYRWPYVPPPRQLELDLTDAADSAAPALKEAP